MTYILQSTAATGSAIILGLIFVAFGLLLMFFGWRIYRVALVVLCVLMGAALGAFLAGLLGITWLILSLPLGILAGVFSAFLEKVGAFLVGGACGLLLFVPFAALLAGTGQSEVVLYVGAFAAFALVGALVVWLWRPLIIFCLSFLGASFIIQGILVVVGHFNASAAQAAVDQHPYALAIATIIVALYGVYHQGQKIVPEKPAETQGEET